ncbi:hypothetical protein ABT065_11430 [Streptomyces sp. NPDC002764]|uniref:hypothetical protein n=1 Tax=Streptomyces sp. NPDC002764 TaxID=3154428 RepID=UPI0033264425
MAVMLSGLPALIGLIAYSAMSCARLCRARLTPPAALRTCFVVLITAALAVYLWGCSHLLLLEDEDRARACLETVGRENARHVDRYIADFVPLRFACHLSSGQSYNALVPGYVNPSVAVLLLSALVCGAAGLLLRRERHVSSTALKKG